MERRDDQPQTATPTSTRPIVLFDGVCNLCSRSVRWIIARDRGGEFRFASLQSRAAERVLADRGVSRDDLPDSMVLIDESGVHVKSDAALGVADRLGPPWSFAELGRLVPRWIRDLVYDAIAKRRHRWFGRTTACQMPAPGDAERFLDRDEAIAESGSEPGDVSP